jgi:hypothetical protein
MTAQTKKSRAFFTGSEAVGIGVFIMLTALAFAAFCIMGGYAFFNQDILRILIPAIIVFAVGSGLMGTWMRRRGR